MTPTNRDPIAAVIAARRNRLLDRRDLFRLLVRLLLVAGAGYLILTRVFLIRQVTGMDMFPAVKDGDLALVFCLQQEYAKEDVISYRTDKGDCFGRILARPGDVVIIGEDGSLLINGTTQSGEILFPTYPAEGIEYPYKVPPDHFFVLGDYRTKAQDSRTLGPIHRQAVQGKVITLLRRRGL